MGQTMTVRSDFYRFLVDGAFQSFTHVHAPGYVLNITQHLTKQNLPCGFSVMLWRFLLGPNFVLHWHVNIHVHMLK